MAGRARYEKPSDHPLREWRKSNAVTQDGLAKQLGCTPAHVSQMEQYRGRPSFDMATSLARITGLPVDRFYFPKRSIGSEPINAAAIAIE